MNTNQGEVGVLLEEARVWSLLGALVSSGVPILQAVKAVAKSSERFGSLFLKMYENANEGVAKLLDNIDTTDSDTNFSWFVPIMVHLGEETGDLDVIATDISKMLTAFATRTGLKIQVDKDKVLKAVDFYALSRTIENGLPLIRSIEFIAEKSTSPNAEVFKKVAKKIENGDSLGHAIREFPENFPDYIALMIEMGEIGGVLDVITKKISDHMISYEIS